MRDDALDGI